MFFGTIEQATTVASANIPITTELATNRKVVNNTTTNTLEIRKQGIYNVDGYLSMSGVQGDIDVNIIADGDLRRTVSVSLPSATAYATVPIVDAIRVVLAEYPQVANIAIRVDTSGLSVFGAIRVEQLM